MKSISVRANSKKQKQVKVKEGIKMVDKKAGLMTIGIGLTAIWGIAVIGTSLGNELEKYDGEEKFAKDSVELVDSYYYALRDSLGPGLPPLKLAEAHEKHRDRVATLIDEIPENNVDFNWSLRATRLGYLTSTANDLDIRMVLSDEEMPRLEIGGKKGNYLFLDLGADNDTNAENAITLLSYIHKVSNYADKDRSPLRETPEGRYFIDKSGAVSFESGVFTEDIDINARSLFRKTDKGVSSKTPKPMQARPS